MLSSFSYNYDIAHNLLCEAKTMMKGNNELTKAKELLESSIHVFPNYVEAHYYLATVYEKINDFGNANCEYQKAIQINPFFSKAYFRLAVIQEEYFQDFDAARKNYEKAIQIKSNYFEPILKLAQLLETKYYNYEKAAHYYDAAHKLRADLPEITYRLARIYQEHLLDYILAKKYFIRTLEADPKNWQAHYYLSLVLGKKLSCKAEGRAHYIKATDLNKSIVSFELDEYFAVDRNDNNYNLRNNLLKVITFLLFLVRFRYW